MRQWITRPTVTAVPPPAQRARRQPSCRRDAQARPGSAPAEHLRRGFAATRRDELGESRPPRDNPRRPQCLHGRHPREDPRPPEFRALLAPGITVTSYIPLGSEADPAPLTHAALQAGCALALPHVARRSDPMRFLAWNPAETLLPGPFGLQQPAADAQEVAPDIILTPLVAFDSKLDRLGQGAGYYDRAFAQFPDAHRIGVAWSVQRTDMLSTDPWDMPLHAIITEHGWISRS
ncbi:5-formyltetrahydrofolate cyclo-ligase [Sphingomonas sp. MMS24-J45]|uniref:5-formyltetrahydrofolate cyclo-ligase n=1 Tax=Sphingomonas sp. MMS24-J45 TaxID=3238806 RepID=UPI0038504660